MKEKKWGVSSIREAGEQKATTVEKVRGVSKEKRVPEPRSLNCHLEELIKSIPR